MESRADRVAGGGRGAPRIGAARAGGPLRRSASHWREALTGIIPAAVLGTWVCCALPITLVSIGAGSVMATLVSSAPWLVGLSRFKGWIFLAAGLLLAIDWWALYRSGRPCEPGGICHASHPVGRWLRRIYWGSVAMYAVALFAAYLSLPILERLGQ